MQPIPFGKYQLFGRINVGGMAEVWSAMPLVGGPSTQVIAVKRMLPNIAEDAELRAMFLGEGQLMTRLVHPNIPTVFEVGSAAGVPFIAMEYVSGQNLRAVFRAICLRQSTLPPSLSCYILGQACEALEYTHRLPLVHQDISPQNLLVGYDAAVKVIDFGLATRPAVSWERADGTTGAATAPPMRPRPGKRSYMSPEQAQGLAIDPRSDLFAVGICLYEMLTCQRLFEERQSDTAGPVQPPSQINSQIPRALDEVVLDALAPEIGSRYQTARELLEDLQRFQSPLKTSRDQLAVLMKSLFGSEIQREQNWLSSLPTPKSEPDA